MRLLLIALLMSPIAVLAEAQEESGDLNQDQRIRLRCMEITASVNTHAGVAAAGGVHHDKKAAEQIRNMTKWCEDYIKTGSMEYKD